MGVKISFFLYMGFVKETITSLEKQFKVERLSVKRHISGVQKQLG